MQHGDKDLALDWSTLRLGFTMLLVRFDKISQLLHERPNHGLFGHSFVNYHLQWRAVSKIIKSYLAWKLPPEKYVLKPDHPFEEDYASCQMAILPEDFFAEADKRKILFKRASLWWFWEGGFEFEAGTMLKTDTVFLATGYDGKRKLKAILPDPSRSLTELPSGMMP